MKNSGVMGGIAALAAALILGSCMLASCGPPQTREYCMGTCVVCGGSGVFRGQSCPSCRGLGYVRVRYSYPVIDPRK